MTTLYRPVPIESAEQAEALPIGTIALLRFGHRTKTAGGWWETPTGGGLDESRTVVGAQALVPIEAEEEGTREFRGSNGTWHMASPVDVYQSPHTRYVTPWEEGTP